MPTLATELRNKLERVVVEARDAAETGARAALEALAVHHHESYPHMKPPQRELRNQLRARARQLGDCKLARPDAVGNDHEIVHLRDECAYEHWHRMLFARFLAENNLLIEPDGSIAISLPEAEELAKEQGLDVWVFASRCAQDMLPQIFRPDDPLLQVSFATEHRIKLERLLASLPPSVFTASDALGWVYQFWQSKKKDEVNRSEVKIGADEIAAVTQLFTEPYMVDFLLHNTLGAWWAGKKLTAADAADAKTEDELRAKLALRGVGWEYLRFVRGADGNGGPWRPAAGTFDGWPKTAAEIKILDPCCGSGHFLVAALNHLVPLRMHEITVASGGREPPVCDVIDAILRDNLHGLEIDERCCQIAAFALAFAAWTCPDGGGYRELPQLHIACTGIGPQCSADEWLKLADESGRPMPRGGREPIHNGLLNLHHVFSQAPTLGSLIDPTELPANLIAADYETIEPYLTAIFNAEKADDETRERAIAAAGMVKAAELLAGEYTLVSTNVPYLKREKQNEVLATFNASRCEDAKSDLATSFAQRCLDFVSSRCTCGLVSPHNWLYARSYTAFRTRLLRYETWRSVARLGPGAFETITGEVVKPALIILSHEAPSSHPQFFGIDTEGVEGAKSKATTLRQGPILHCGQRQQLKHPDAVVSLVAVAGGEQLQAYADSAEGLSTGDADCYMRCWWELGKITWQWAPLQAGPLDGRIWGGVSHAVFWESGEGSLSKSPAARIQGQIGWGARGVIVSEMSDLRRSLHMGCMHDKTTGVVIAKKQKHLPAIWAFCESDSYREAIRQMDKSLKVAPRSLVKVPFDLEHWQNVAEERFPDGLPEPESDEPTEWCFHGHPFEAAQDTMLQVAIARLLGYRWPAELDPEMRLSKRARELAARCEELMDYADDDGIVCIPSVRGEEPAAEQLVALLTACDIEPDVDLDDWLRNEFFEAHCKLFHDRPFVWHIWDGRKRDGFQALVNYHKLSEGSGKGRRLLESLTYAYLGEWITRQRDGVKRGEEGADDRLAAALELEKRLQAILAGEPPFDIFVRWKPLADQPIGWQPDVNDGVRLNIRPFLASDLSGGRTGAGVLRYKPNLKWTKDRGKEPERPKAEYPWFWGWDEKTEDFAGGKIFDGNRWNDCHYTNKAKQAAREAAVNK